MELITKEVKALQVLSKLYGKQIGGTDREGEISLKPAAYSTVLNEIVIKSENNVITRKVKRMDNTINEAINVLSESIDKVETLTEKLQREEESMASSTKRTIGKVKTTVSQLSDSLAKVEKLANFDKLERYNNTLCSIADSLERISALEKGGKLDAVIKALKG